MDALYGHFAAVTTHQTAPIIDLTRDSDTEDWMTLTNTCASEESSATFVDLTQTDDEASHPTPRFLRRTNKDAYRVGDQRELIGRSIPRPVVTVSSPTMFEVEPHPYVPRKAIAAADDHVHPNRLALTQVPDAEDAVVSWGSDLERDRGLTGRKAMFGFGSGQTYTTPRKHPSQRRKAAKAAHYRDGDVVGAFAPAISDDNRGRAMLQKMGWTAGTALGINGTGVLEPVKHTMKTSKAGLAFVSEGPPQKSSAIRSNSNGTTLTYQSNDALAKDCTTEETGISFVSKQTQTRDVDSVLLRLVQEEISRQREEDRWLLKLKKKFQKQELDKNPEMRRKRDIRCAAREQFQASAEGRALVKRNFAMLHKMRASTDPQKQRTLKLERRIVLRTLKARIQSAEAWAVACARHANGERAGEVLQRTMSTTTVKGTGSNTIPLGARQPGTQDILHQYDGTHSSLHSQSSGGDSTPFAQRTSTANESIYEPMVSVNSPLHAPNSHMNSGFGLCPAASSGRRDSFTVKELADVMMDIDTGTM